VIAALVNAAHVVRRERPAVATFWDQADCPPAPDSCWRWHGAIDGTDRPVLRIRRTAVHAVRVAWYAVTREFPVATRFTHVCGDARCVRPSHARWSTSTLHRREGVSHSGGYAGHMAAMSPDAECAAARRWSISRHPPVARRRPGLTPNA
jgi:hypothetical protein